jgi:type II secretory pathway pseudopilin PulG
MTRVRSRGGGWVLLELLLALTIFVFTAISVLGAVSQGIAGAERTRDLAQAADLARSTMAKLEAGLGTIQNLAGPVPAWDPAAATDAEFSELGAGSSDSPPLPSLWEIEIDTLASEFPGLTHVTVTAIKRPIPESERIAASFALHQLVRLGPDAADAADPLLGSGSWPGASPLRFGGVP